MDVEQIVEAPEIYILARSSLENEFNHLPTISTPISTLKAVEVNRYIIMQMDQQDNLNVEIT